MDRSTIEGDPHSVLEGLIIGSYAIGAHRGFVLYPRRVPPGHRPAGNGVGRPRANEASWARTSSVPAGISTSRSVWEPAPLSAARRPPHPLYRGQARHAKTQASLSFGLGLWRKPTVINNVETLATIPVVILDGPVNGSRGSERRRAREPRYSPCLATWRTRVHRDPHGTTLRDVVSASEGGNQGRRRFRRCRPEVPREDACPFPRSTPPSITRTSRPRGASWAPAA
jgi:hypothetical protein